jgi:hypothetical protein
MKGSVLSLAVLVLASTVSAVAQTIPPSGFAGRWSLTLQTQPQAPLEFVVARSATGVSGTFDAKPFAGAIENGVLNVTLAKVNDTSAYTTLTATKLPNGNLTGTMVYNFEYGPGQWMGKSSHFVATPIPAR